MPPHPCRPRSRPRSRSLRTSHPRGRRRRDQRTGRQPRHHRRRPPLRRQRVPDPRPRPPDRRQGHRAAPGAKKTDTRAAGVTCPHCGQAAEFHSHRAHTSLSLVGPIRYRRAYYLCRALRQGAVPLRSRRRADGPRPDAGLGAGRHLGRGGRRQLREGGRPARGDGRRPARRSRPSSGPPRTPAGAWPRRSQAGVALRPEGGLALAQGLRRQAMRLRRDRRHRRPAAGRGGRPRRGPHGLRGDGLQPPPRVALARREAPADAGASTSRGCTPWRTSRPLLRTPAGHVGMDRADRWIGLSDGGNGLEDRLRENFPRVEVVILDFFHPAEKLTGLARRLHPQDEGRAEEQAR